MLRSLKHVFNVLLIFKQTQLLIVGGQRVEINQGGKLKINCLPNTFVGL